MIDTKLETFTATEAVNSGLVEAVKRGDCVINGRYTLMKDGYVKFKQNNLVFRDKNEGLRIGMFTDTAELINFCRKVAEYDK